MQPSHVFLSHAWADKVEVDVLRRTLEAHGIVVWVDTREMTAGHPLSAELRAKIEAARAFLVLLTPSALASPWVAKELTLAKKVASKVDGYRVIPIVAEPVSRMEVRSRLGVRHEPLSIAVKLAPGWAGDIALRLLAALGEAVPTGEADIRVSLSTPLAELRIEVQQPTILVTEGRRVAAATTRLFFTPIGGGPEIRTPPFKFLEPPAIDQDELRWYLESYVRWPFGLLRDRAKRVELLLPQWGRLLLDQLSRANTANVWHAFRAAPAERRISVCIDPELVDATNEETLQAREAETRLLSLPWELLHDDGGYLFLDEHGARVRRKLPNYDNKAAIDTSSPLRVLLLSPRPEDDLVGHLDHRASAIPVVEAIECLGERAQLRVLSTPTLGALTEEVKRAANAGTPYHVVHFDGHGIYDKRLGLGALCLEDPKDSERLERRASCLVPGSALAAILRNHRVPLVVLEACQSAQSDTQVDASVAGQLLRGGVASVVAMSHSLLVETARRFVAAFYGALCDGHRVGEAMLRAQRMLATDRQRAPSAHESFELHDWFVPVLYQEDEDPRLVHELPGATARELGARRRQAWLGDVPKALPPHGFVGRSRELLRAERMLLRSRHISIRGQGGEGKTALATELAQWLVRTNRFGRAALVAFDRLPRPDKLGALGAIGEQLVTGFTTRAAGDEAEAWSLVERALREDRVLLVFDNLETVLPSPGSAAVDAQAAAELLTWIESLVHIQETHVVMTTREPLPAPLGANDLLLGRLDRDDAITLVHDVLDTKNMSPRTGSETLEAIAGLVEAVDGHARSLVLLAPEVALAGVQATMAELADIMRAQDEQHPGNRERSLLASVELSLRRLPPAVRDRLPPLAVFLGGGQLWVIFQVLGLGMGRDEELAFARQLVSVGMAELLPYDYLRLDPALSAALAARLDPATRGAARAAWLTAMQALVAFLYEQQSEDIRLAATLTVLDLANLLAAMRYTAESGEPVEVVGLANRLEGLLQTIGRPGPLAQVVALREAAARRLDEWSHQTFNASGLAIERLLDGDRVDEAVAAALALLERAEAAGEHAFHEAPYDLATCNILLGKTLKRRGTVAKALAPLREARRRFEALSAAGDKDAANMMTVALSEHGDCLVELGRLEEAAAAYEEAMGRATALNNRRQVAVNKGQLGSVRLLERRFAEAIVVYREALATFTDLGEPVSVAVAWHQLGRAYRQAGQFEAAEEAYVSALRLRSGLRSQAGEASALNALGNLYQAQDRHEEAVRYYRRAAELHVGLHDRRAEGFDRHNAALSLIRLRQLDEARRELKRAVECDESFGHAARPWVTFDHLATLERAAGDPAAASEARACARATFFAYRRDGGENPNPAAHLARLVAEAVDSGSTAETYATLTDLAANSDRSAGNGPVVVALLTILHGNRDPALADDPALDFDDAAEIQLLLEHLARCD